MIFNLKIPHLDVNFCNLTEVYFIIYWPRKIIFLNCFSKKSIISWVSLINPILTNISVFLLVANNAMYLRIKFLRYFKVIYHSSTCKSIIWLSENGTIWPHERRIFSEHYLFHPISVFTVSIKLRLCLACVKWVCLFKVHIYLRLCRPK